MFGTLRNGTLAFGITLALVGAGATAWADLPGADPTAQTTRAATDTANLGPKAPEPRLFTLAELSFFFEKVATSDDGMQRVNDLGALGGGATGGGLR